MRAYQEPLDALFEVLKDFARYPAMRLLHVRTDRDLHGPAAELAMGVEYHADNLSPFYRLDGIHGPSIHEAWTETLRTQHAARAEGMAARGYALPPLRALPAGQSAAEAFASTLVQIGAARCDPLSGLVLVLAPVAVENPSRLDEEIRTLLLSSTMRGLRIVLVEADAASLSEETWQTFKQAGAFHAAEARVDRDAEKAHLAQTVEAAQRAPRNAPAAAQTGAAWPDGELPPRRRGDPEPLTAEQTETLAQELGVPKGLLDGSLRQVRTAILASSVALRDNDPLGAMTLQMRAAEQTHGAGMPREGMVLELLAATSLIQAGERGMAFDRFRDVAGRAEREAFHDLAAQAHMAVGALQMIDKDQAAASVSYGRAGRVARDGGVTNLAIEGYRMAGQLAVSTGNPDMAVGLFNEALRLANDLDRPDQKQTSAPLAARQLAEEYRRRGDGGQAAALEAQATLMER